MFLGQSWLVELIVSAIGGTQINHERERASERERETLLTQVVFKHNLREAVNQANENGQVMCCLGFLYIYSARLGNYNHHLSFSFRKPTIH